MKCCKICKVEKELTEFYTVNQRGKTRHMLHCIECNKERDKSPRCRWSRARALQRRRGVEFTVTVEQYEELAKLPCHYCGGPTHDTSGSGLDRVDRSKGYTLGNVVPCCWLCNHVKGTTFSEDEMKEVGQLLAVFQARRRSVGEPPLAPPTHGTSRTPRFWLNPEKRAKWEYIQNGQKN